MCAYIAHAPSERVPHAELADLRVLLVEQLLRLVLTLQRAVQLRAHLLEARPLDRVRNLTTSQQRT